MSTPAEEAFAGTKPVEERHRLDEVKLDAWLRENVEGYRGPLTLWQFKGGQSNPTYKIETAAGRTFCAASRSASSCRRRMPSTVSSG